MSDQDYTKLTVPQLRAALSERGLDDKGKKTDLIKRLLEHDESQEKMEAEDAKDAEMDQGNEEENGEEVEDKIKKEDCEGINDDEALEDEEANEVNAEGRDEEANEEANEEEANEEANDVEGNDDIDKEDAIESGNFIMIDEAEDDDLDGPTNEDDINEDELLGGNEDDGEGKDDDAEESENQDKKDSEEAQEGDKDGKDAKKESSKQKDDKSSKDKSQNKKKERKEPELQAVEGGIPEDEIRTLEAAYKKRQEEEQAKADRLFGKRFIYRVYKHACLQFMEESLHSKSVVIKKFAAEHIKLPVVQESIESAESVNMHIGNKDDSYCELIFKNNKLCKEVRTKVTEALEDCEVSVATRDLLKSVFTYADKRVNPAPEYQEKYRECMLLATIALSKEEEEKEAEKFEPDVIEDEVFTYFPSARCVTVPPSLDVSTIYRFVLVEFATTTEAEEALKTTKEKEVRVGGKKINFSIYQKKWLEEKRRMKREANEKKDPIRDMVKDSEDSAVMTEEERLKCRLRIEQVYKSLKPYKTDDMYYKILSDEKTLMREKLRQDDRKRDKQKLPVLQWNPDTHKEEEKVERKEREKKDTPKSNSNKDNKDKEKDGNTKKRNDSDRKRRNSPQRAGQKRGRSPSRDRNRNNKQARGGDNRSNSPRRGGGRRWQDRQSNNQSSIMGQPPNFRMNAMQQQQQRVGNQMQVHGRQVGGRAGGVQQQQQQRMNMNRGGRGGMNRNMAGTGPMMMDINMMNANAGMMPAGAHMHPGMMQPQQHMQHMQANMAANQAMIGANPMAGVGAGQQQSAAMAPAASSEPGSSNPVQLLLGLSKVLSNQIKQMQTTDGPAQPGQQNTSTTAASRSSYPEQGDASYYRREGAGGGASGRSGASSAGGYDRSAGGYY